MLFAYCKIYFKLEKIMNTSPLKKIWEIPGPMHPQNYTWLINTPTGLYWIHGLIEKSDILVKKIDLNSGLTTTEATFDNLAINDVSPIWYSDKTLYFKYNFHSIQSLSMGANKINTLVQISDQNYFNQIGNIKNNILISSSDPDMPRKKDYLLFNTMNCELIPLSYSELDNYAKNNLIKPNTLIRTTFEPMFNKYRWSESEVLESVVISESNPSWSLNLYNPNKHIIYSNVYPDNWLSLPDSGHWYGKKDFRITLGHSLVCSNSGFSFVERFEKNPTFETMNIKVVVYSRKPKWTKYEYNLPSNIWDRFDSGRFTSVLIENKLVICNGISLICFSCDQ